MTYLNYQTFLWEYTHAGGVYFEVPIAFHKALIYKMFICFSFTDFSYIIGESTGPVKNIKNAPQAIIIEVS